MNITIQDVLKEVEQKKISKHKAFERIEELTNKRTEGLFTRTYIHDELLLKDHTVFGKQTLLGVTHCSLAIEAATSFFPEKMVQIKKLLFSNPVVFQPGEFIDIQLQLLKKDNKTYFQNQFESFIEQGKKTTAEGEYFVGELNQPVPKDFTTILNHYDKKVEGRDLYLNLSKSSVVHGPSLQTVEEVFVLGNEVLGRLILNESFSKEGYEYFVHPALMDGAVVSSMFGVKQKLKYAYIPLMMKAVKVYARVPDIAYSHSKLIKVNEDIVIADLTICDESGNVCLEINGLTCKAIRSAESLKSDETKTPDKIENNHNAETGNLNEIGIASAHYEVDQSINNYLIEKIKQIMKDKRQKVSSTKNFMDLGIDSVSLIELAQSLEKELGVELYPTLFFEHQNIDELTAFFLNEHEKELTAYFGSKGKSQVERPEDFTPSEIFEVAEKNRSAGAIQVTEAEDIDNDLAVIGMSGLFADSPNLNEFWNNIIEKKDLIREIPNSHFNYEPWFDPDPQVKDKLYCKWGSFIDDVDKFDAEFFNISPREAEMMDPQLRLLLQVLYSTAEDAGYPSKIKGTKTGMYVGACFQDYKDRLPKEVDPHSGTGNAATMLANRPSFYFNLHGPSLFVDTACSSSLVALHLASKALRNKECEMAFVAGANLLLSSHHYRYFCSIGALSQTGRCHTFDEKADGYVPGEGVGAILLKPLKKAIQDKDQIHAIIKGSAINHGGYTPSITAPSMKLEAQVITEAWNDARIDPYSIGYIEAHGTGTKLGDPIEINALKEAFKSYPAADPYCSVGSAKAHIGHAEGAAGIAGIIKVILSMKNKTIPAMPKFETPNPYIKLENSPLYINREPIAWNTPEGLPRRAGVSSFGFGGAYAHVVVEEFDSDQLNKEYSEKTGDTEPQLIMMSAKNEEILKVKALEMTDFLLKSSTVRLQDIAYTLYSGREAMEERLAMVVHTKKELVEFLKQYVSGKTKNFDLYKGNIYDDEMNEKVDIVNVMPLEHNEKIGYLKAVAKQWVTGANLEKEKLFEGAKFVQLPVYPFSKKRHWVDEPPVRAEMAKVADHKHPLIDNMNLKLSLKENGIVFEKKLDRSQSILTDHVVHGNMLLPGVCYLEMVRAAGTALFNEPIELANVVWLHPVILDEETRTIKIILKEGKVNTEFEIQSTENGQKISHSQGIIMPRNKVETSANSFNAEELKLQCTYKVEADEVYHAFEQLGVDYGPYFQSIKEVWTGEGQALAILEMPKTNAGEAHNFEFHPSILDGALQAIIGLGGQKDHANETLLPFSVEKVNFYRKTGERVYAHIKKIDQSCYNVGIYDDLGLLIELEELSILKAKDSFDNFFYYPEWQIEPLSQTAYESKKVKKVLLVYSLSQEKLAKALQKRHIHDEITWIELSEGTEVQNIGGKWTVDVNRQDAFLRCMEESDGYDLIYHLGGIFSEYSKSIDPGLLNKFQKYGILSLYRLVKSISHSQLTQRPIDLKVITNNLYDIEGERIIPYSAALSGFAKSLAKEYSDWNVSSLDISIEDIKIDLHLLAKQVAEEPCTKHGNEVIFRQGKRYVQQQIPITLPNSSKTPFKEGGVYLIIGGAGGIGLEFCHYLAKTVKAKIAIVGRSPLTEEKKKKISIIEKAESKVLYIQADINEEESLKAAVEKTKSIYGVINGVIHSALVLNDRTVEFMEEETLLEVLAPKVMGSINLGNALKNEPLDFMVFFSSAQSFAGSPGQSNYAAACSFKDAYARFLAQTRNHPVQIINWGYWGSVGVVANQAYNKKLESQGIQSIMPREGMEAIKRIVDSGIKQIMPFKANRMVLEMVGVNFQHKAAIAPGNQSILKEAINYMKIPNIEEEEVQQITKAMKDLDNFTSQLVLCIFQRMGVFMDQGERYSKESLFANLKISLKYRRLFNALLDVLSKSGFIRCQGDFLETTSKISEENNTSSLSSIYHKKDALLFEYPGIKAQIALLWRCYEHYPDVITGALSAADLIFPQSSMDLVEGIYKGNKTVDYFNELVVSSITSYIKHAKCSDKIKILEIGAGTGGTTSSILEAIDPYRERIQYTYTDISPAFTRYGLTNFGEKYPFVEFKVLNIEEDIMSQGYNPGEYDVVIAANVLHATRNIQITFKQIKALLKKNGWLVINEATSSMNFLTATFGLLDGWWLYEDSTQRIEHSPLLNVKMWESKFKREGFYQSHILGLKEKEEWALKQNVLVAESNGISKREVLETPSELEKNNASRSDAVVYFESEETKEWDVPLQENFKQADHLQKEDIINNIQTKIVTILAGILKLESKDVKLIRPFADYGVDSILGLELIKKLNKEFSINLRTTVLFDYASIKELTNYVYNQYGSDVVGTLDRTGIQDISIENRDITADHKIADQKRDKQITDDLPDKVQKVLSSHLVKILRTGEKQLIAGKPFVEYGLDSILGLEFIKFINQKFNISLRTTVLFDYTNLKDLALFISGNYKEETARFFEAELNEIYEDHKEEAPELQLLQSLAAGELSSEEVLRLMGVGDGQPNTN
ncbi:SDR family NAD(P)-dependent oxidoreductase [Fictibacillus phosphorivorans]|uniref:SDR family NAD(P)-dependent oxidoreductase n=1 Tax=Fictibacillus phosphorivorans TaxID=1221500 RepID=UPI003CEA5C06